MAQRSADVDAGKRIGADENGLRQLLADQTAGMAAEMGGPNGSYDVAVDLDKGGSPNAFLMLINKESINQPAIIIIINISFVLFFCFLIVFCSAKRPFSRTL